MGGSTVVNGGMSWRTPPDVLELWARREGIPELLPEQMERHFEKVERRLSVSWQDPESIGRDSELLKAGADAKGWKIIPNRRNQLHCGGCDNCMSGCPTGAKRSMLVTNLPRALGRGARLYADCRVHRITRRGKTVTGIEGRFTRPERRGGPRLSVRAPVVVCACGSLQTPALLWRSGLRRPHLGRHLTLHPSARLLALFDDEVLGWKGVHQAYQVREFIDDGILITATNLPPSLVAFGLPQHGASLGRLMAEYNRMVVGGCLVEDSTRGRVRQVPGVGPVAFYQITERDVERVVRAMALTAEIMFAAGALRVIPPFENALPLLGPDQTAAFLTERIPASALELVSVHIMGTARMSQDPGRGVVSGFGEVYGVSGLFVADASLFPGPIGVNPMESIMGLVTRNAEWLIENRRRWGV